MDHVPDRFLLIGFFLVKIKNHSGFKQSGLLTHPSNELSLARQAWGQN